MIILTDRQLDKKFVRFLLDTGVAKRTSLRYITIYDKYPVIFYSASMIENQNYVELRLKGIIMSKNEVEIELIPPMGVVSRSKIVEEGVKITIDGQFFNIRKKVYASNINITNKILYSGIWIKYPTYIFTMSCKLKGLKFYFSRTSDINNYQTLLSSPDRIINKPFIRILKVQPGVYLLGTY